MKENKAGWQSVNSSWQFRCITQFANSLLQTGNLLFISMLLCCGVKTTSAQSNSIDEVVAVVGNKIIKKSDIEKQYAQYVASGNTETEGIRCAVLENLMLQKLLVLQAETDSVEVSDAQVEQELDRRIRYFVKQIGSEQLLEEYYKEPIAQIKDDFRKMVREQIVVQTMQSKITKDISATPADVRDYYKKIPADSLPYISAELEVAHIVKKPPVSEAQKLEIKERLEGYKKRIAEGEDFSVLAALYSDDRSTAKKGAELGFFERGDMVPEFEAAAFKLKTGEISPVVESKFGFHILQLIERRGNQINVRHLLLQPKVSEDESAKAITSLDSIAGIIRRGEMTFEAAAEKFSDDEDTRYNNGTIVNPNTGNTRFQPDQLDKILFFQIDTMPVGAVSKPLPWQTADGKTFYRLVLVRSRTQPHKANLKEDYQKIQNVVLENKQQKAMEDWVKKQSKTSYIHIDKEYSDCVNIKSWLHSDGKGN
jgi:peptidyl-prolyl cis-trans isomerase SurA